MGSSSVYLIEEFLIISSLPHLFLDIGCGFSAFVLVVLLVSLSGLLILIWGVVFGQVSWFPFLGGPGSWFSYRTGGRFPDPASGSGIIPVIYPADGGTRRFFYLVVYLVTLLSNLL
ncbi:hypothetical protein M513_13779, partial [Trichuris suis]